MNKAELILTDYHANIFRDDLDISLYSSHYKDYDSKICEIFSTWHLEINDLLSFLNEKSKVNNHYNAHESRVLNALIEQIVELLSHLKNTRYEFEVDLYVKKQLDYISTFLVDSGGSSIPEDFEKIIIKKYEPIFYLANKTVDVNSNSNLPLKNIGEGAFAVVGKYKDPSYDIYFAVKCLKKGSDVRDKARFKEEYQILSSLQSPYILSVYRFEEDNERYFMEYCDTTLKKYYEKHNSKLKFYTRKRIAQQFLYAISYIHHKKILHRDLSYNNILLKLYDSGVIGLKLSDFGLGKTENSDFTKSDTELKGTIVDPALDKFKDYSIANEIYAVGMILNFIFTGKQSFSYSSDSELKKIVNTCTNQDLNKRYKNIQEILKNIDLLLEEDV